MKSNNRSLATTVTVHLSRAAYAALEKLARESKVKPGTYAMERLEVIIIDNYEERFQETISGSPVPSHTRNQAHPNVDSRSSSNGGEKEIERQSSGNERQEQEGIEGSGTTAA